MNRMEPGGRWNFRVLLPAVFVVMFIAAELWLSVFGPSKLPGPLANHWTMFNRVRERTTVVVERDDGHRGTVDLEQWVYYRRHGVDYVSELPPHICRHDSAVREVEIRTGARTATFRCPD